jgi:hypothetical protein
MRSAVTVVADMLKTGVVVVVDEEGN